MLEEDEEKAITIYSGKDQSKIDLDPSKPFPSKKLENNETPMLLAAKLALSKLFKLFLEQNGNPKAEGLKSDNCLHMVCAMPNNPLIRAELIDEILNWRGNKRDNLIDKNMHEKVLIDHVNNDGNTAIHLAAFNGLLQCVEKLVEYGASLTIINNHDNTSCEMADQTGNFGLGTMIELALLFKPNDNKNLQIDQFYKLSTEAHYTRVILDTHSITLNSFNEFINQSIKFICKEIDENPSRAEVLLNYYNWNSSQLKKDYLANPEKILLQAKLKPTNKLLTSYGISKYFI
jgi:ankyrin repeat protein